MAITEMTLDADTSYSGYQLRLHMRSVEIPTGHQLRFCWKLPDDISEAKGMIDLDFGS